MSLGANNFQPHPETDRMSMGDNQKTTMKLPRYHQRAFAHNYHAPFIYHIILTKKKGVEPFGVVEGDARIAPGMPGSAQIHLT